MLFKTKQGIIMYVSFWIVGAFYGIELFIAFVNSEGCWNNDEKFPVLRPNKKCSALDLFVRKLV